MVPSWVEEGERERGGATVWRKRGRGVVPSWVEEGERERGGAIVGRRGREGQGWCHRE